MIKLKAIEPLRGLHRYSAWKAGWADKDSIDVFSYISNECSPEDFLLCCKLLFPDFVIIDGAVLLEHKYEAGTFQSWVSQFNGDLCAIEKVVNHTHMYDVFEGCSDDVDEAVFTQLAEVICLSWRLLLRDKFPDKKFCVDVLNSDQEYGPVVTFYQVL